MKTKHLCVTVPSDWPAMMNGSKRVRRVKKKLQSSFSGNGVQGSDVTWLAPCMNAN